MLRITIPATVVESFDEQTNEFIYETIEEERTLELEHSLVTLSEWESRWHKPFISNKDKTTEELLDYIKIMTVTPDVEPELYGRLSVGNFDQIQKYINDPMTATTFSKDNTGKTNREIVTSEVIYYWMTALNIPFECQHWHLNRLLTLIRVCNVKNAPDKKMSKRDILANNAKLNAARRKQLNSRG